MIGDIERINWVVQFSSVIGLSLVPIPMPKMSATDDQCQAFKDTVQSIATDVVDLTAPDDLFLDERFVEIFETPSLHLACAEVLIDESSLDDTARAVIALGMQRVGLEGYLRLAKEALAGQRAGTVSLRLLEMVLIPPVSWGDRLLLSFDDPRVISLMSEYLKIDGVNASTARYVRSEVLSGRAAARRRAQD